MSSRGYVARRAPEIDPGRLHIHTGLSAGVLLIRRERFLYSQVTRHGSYLYECARPIVSRGMSIVQLPNTAYVPSPKGPVNLLGGNINEVTENRKGERC